MRPYIHLFYNALNSTVEPKISQIQSALLKTLSPTKINPNFSYDKSRLFSEDYVKTSQNPGFHLFLMGTGGTESHFLRYLSSLEKYGTEEEKRYPLILLAHGDLNSLAASLECMASIRANKRKGFLFNIGEEERLHLLFRVLNAKLRLVDQKFGIFGEPSDWLISSNLDILKGKSQLMGIPLKESLEKIRWEEILERSEKIANDDPKLLKIAEDFIQKAEPTWHKKSEIHSKDEVIKNAKLFLAIEQIKNTHNLSGLTLRCFDLLKFNVTGCLAMSFLNDIGVPSSCEGDIPSMFTMTLAYHLTNSPSFMANPIDFSENKLTLAHCTIPRNLTSKYVLRTHFESDKGVAIQADLKDADQSWTLSRINVFENDVYSKEVKISNIPFNKKSDSRCRTQIVVEFKNREELQEFLVSSSGNHHILTPGNHAEAFRLFRQLFF